MEESSQSDHEQDTGVRMNGQLVFRSTSGDNESNEAAPLLISTASESTVPSQRPQKKRKMTSWVWNHFQKQDDSVLCLECIQSNKREEGTFSTSTATSNLVNHLKKKHKIVKDAGTRDINQTTLSRQATLQRHNILDGEALSNVKVSLTNMIVDAKLSFSLVEKDRSMRKRFRSSRRLFVRLAAILH